MKTLAKSLGLAMIIRDEAENLSKSLGPIAKQVDEVVVVDTGSTDQSPEIARNFGAKVLSFNWVDDFSAARNFAISHFSSDYILWLDADNSISPSDLFLLKKELTEDNLIILATEVVVPQGDRLWQKRVFPHNSSVHFTGRIHEQLTHPPDYRQIMTKAEIMHWGYQKDAQKKGLRNLNLLLKDPETLRGDFYHLYQTGRTLFNLKRPEEALIYLSRAVEQDVQQNPGLWSHCLIMIAKIYQRKGHFTKAKDTLIKLLNNREDYGEGHFRMGQLLYEEKDYPAAARELETALELGTGDPHFGAIEKNFTAAFLLAKIKLLAGEDGPAENALMKALKFSPDSPEPLVELASLAISRGLRQKAEEHLAQAFSRAPGHRRATYLAQKLAALC